MTLVIGANGKIGRLFCQRAGATVRAMLRSQEQRPFFAQHSIDTVLGDLEGDFAHALEGCQRVVFTAGSGGNTGGDKTLLVDLYGAIRAIEESERRGVSHFVMVSALRADEPLAAHPAMRHYFVAKKLADDRLRASTLPYTILRPGRLSDEPPSGCVRSDLAASGGIDISRGNVAQCIEAALACEASKGRVVDLLDGEQPIESLFSA
jgi:uncharacterized protein YbjT (DUF2867 family)